MPCPRSTRLREKKIPWSKPQEPYHRKSDFATAAKPRSPSIPKQELDLTSTRAVHGSEKSSSVSRRQNNLPQERRMTSSGKHRDSTANRNPMGSPPPPLLPAKRPERRPSLGGKAHPSPHTPRPSPSGPANEEQVRVRFHSGRRTDVKIAGRDGLPPLVVRFR